MTATQPSAEASSPGLARNAIGLPEVLFQSITHMAPAVATALSIGAATSFAGGITPLAVLFAMIAVLFTAYSMAELARHLPSAGGMYTYVGRGLGSFFGWLVAWGFALAEPLVMPLLLGGFGFYERLLLLVPRHRLRVRVGGPGDPVRASRVVADVSGSWALDANRHRARRDRDRDFLLISTLLIVNAGENTLSASFQARTASNPPSRA